MSGLTIAATSFIATLVFAYLLAMLAIIRGDWTPRAPARPAPGPPSRPGRSR